MSFDVFFQGFLASESSERGGVQMREVLAPHDALAHGLLRRPLGRADPGDGDSAAEPDDRVIVADRVRSVPDKL